MYVPVLVPMHKYGEVAVKGTLSFCKYVPVLAPMRKYGAVTAKEGRVPRKALIKNIRARSSVG